MDVRLSPEQQVACATRAAQVVDRSGRPRASADLDDGERTAKLDAAVARVRLARAAHGRRTAEHRWRLAVEVAIVAEELGRGLADVAFLGPTLAAELRRLSGAPTALEPETVALSADLGRPAVRRERRAVPAGSRRHRCPRGRLARSCSWPAANGYTLGAVALERSKPSRST